MKLFFLLVILSEGLCLASAKGEDYVWGTREPNDQLLEWRSIVFPWDENWQQHTIRFPIVAEYIVPITCITISNDLDNRYQTATIVDGGIGQRSVQIRFFSPAFRPINFEVYIYGIVIHRL